MSNRKLIDAQVAWNFKLKEYKRKLNTVLSTKEVEDNDIDLCKLRIAYNYCIEKLTTIVDTYAYLIELRNDEQLTQSFLDNQLQLIKRNQKAFNEEANKEDIKSLENKYINVIKSTTIM